MNFNKIVINLFSQSLVLKIINKTLLMHFFKTVLLILQNNSCSSFCMNSCNNIREIIFKFFRICNCLINIFFDFTDDLGQLIVTDRKVFLECFNRLLTRFKKNDWDFVHKVNFRYEHSTEKRTNQSPIFKVSIYSNSI